MRKKYEWCESTKQSILILHKDLGVIYLRDKQSTMIIFFLGNY